MLSLSTFISPASLFCGSAHHDVYYCHDWYIFQGCAGVVIQGFWEWSGRSGRYCEERGHGKGVRSMVSHTTCFFTPFLVSFIGVIFTFATYNFNIRGRQRWNVQVRSSSIVIGTFSTLFINGVFIDAVFKEWASAEHCIILSTIAASDDDEQARRGDQTSHSNTKIMAR